MLEKRYTRYQCQTFFDVQPRFSSNCFLHMEVLSSPVALNLLPLSPPLLQSSPSSNTAIDESYINVVRYLINLHIPYYMLPTQMKMTGLHDINHRSQTGCLAECSWYSNLTKLVPEKEGFIHRMWPDWIVLHEIQWHSGRKETWSSWHKQEIEGTHSSWAFWITERRIKWHSSSHYAR